VRSLQLSKVETINFGESWSALKFAQTPYDRIIEPVFTTQSRARSQTVSALHVIVNGKCVVKTDFAPFAD